MKYPHAIQFCLIASVAVAAMPATAAEPAAPLGNIEEKHSYLLGYQIAAPLESRRKEIDVKALVRGIEDALSGRASLITEKEMQKVTKDFQAVLESKRKALSEKNLAASKAFFARNAKEQGVVALPSGLQYKVVTSGTGAQATRDDTMTAHYVGTLLTGEEFDSSRKAGRPMTFTLVGVIPGWSEVLQKMRVGDKWKVFIPPQLGYAEHGSPPAIGPNEALIFEIELLALNSQEPVKSSDAQAPPRN